MTHQYLFRFDNRGQAEAALAALTAVEFGGKQVFGADLSGNDIHLGCQLFDEIDEGGEICGLPDRSERIPFFDLFYAIDAVKSASHHPEGVLWLRTGQHTVHNEPVSILDIAPTIYDLMGVAGAIGREPFHGASLRRHFRPAVVAARKAA